MKALKLQHRQSGFSLIELIMVIVILGILTATALPKFVDLGTDAAVAVADSTYGAAKSAAAINHAAVILDATRPKITDGASLLATMDVDANWVAHGATLVGTIKSNTYTITVTTAQTATTSAVLSKGW